MNCDVCDKPVERTDDTTMLESLVYAESVSSAFLLVSNARHILCSPSRAQYIVHEDFVETIDERVSFDKRCLPAPMRKSRETLWTAAWEALQKENSD
jgi:hypothetical protein